MEKLDQIKVLNTNLFILTSQVAAKLREVSTYVKQADGTR